MYGTQLRTKMRSDEKPRYLHCVPRSLRFIPPSLRCVPRSPRLVPRSLRCVPPSLRLVPRSPRLVPRSLRCVPPSPPLVHYVLRCRLCSSVSKLRSFIALQIGYLVQRSMVLSILFSVPRALNTSSSSVKGQRLSSEFTTVIMLVCACA